MRLPKLTFFDRIRMALKRVLSKTNDATQPLEALEPVEKVVVCEPNFGEALTDVLHDYLATTHTESPSVTATCPPSISHSVQFCQDQYSDTQITTNSASDHRSSTSSDDSSPEEINTPPPIPTHIDEPPPFKYAGFEPLTGYEHWGRHDWDRVEDALRAIELGRFLPTPEIVTLTELPVLQDDVQLGHDQQIRTQASSGGETVTSQPSSNLPSPVVSSLNGTTPHETQKQTSVPRQDPPRILPCPYYGLDFSIHGIVGYGGFGRVMMAKVFQRGSPNPEQGCLCAIKVMHKDKVYDFGGAREFVRNEERACERIMKSPERFLAKVVASWDDEQNIYFVMPLYSGDLTKHIPRSSCLRERDRLQVAIAELVSAVEHLHGVGIMHRDIKPNNVFISNDGHVALGDFGLAHVTPTPSSLYSESGIPKTDVEGVDDVFCGTDDYMAPELIEQLEAANANPDTGRMMRYTCKMDVWALGLVIYEMALGQPLPWFSEPMMERDDRGNAANQCRQRRHDDKQRKFEKIKQGILDWERVASVDVQLAELLKRILSVKPEHRITMDQAMRHPYFDGFDWAGLRSETVLGPFRDDPQPNRFIPRTSLSFRTFHAGKESEARMVDENGRVVVNSAVRRHKETDRKEPYAHWFVCDDFEAFFTTLGAVVIRHDQEPSSTLSGP